MPFTLLPHWLCFLRQFLFLEWIIKEKGGSTDREHSVYYHNSSMLVANRAHLLHRAVCSFANLPGKTKFEFLGGLRNQQQAATYRDLQKEKLLDWGIVRIYYPDYISWICIVIYSEQVLFGSQRHIYSLTI